MQREANALLREARKLAAKQPSGDKVKLSLKNGDTVQIHNVSAFAVATFSASSEEAEIVRNTVSFKETGGRLYELLTMIVGR